VQKASDLFCIARMVSLGMTALSLTGCNALTPHDESWPHVGDAMAANRAIHVVDPWPAKSNNVVIGSDGVRVADVMARYRSGALPGGNKPGSSNAAPAPAASQ
jgi:type IV pilus biogenesis protein CpaD/CtpE